MLRINLLLFAAFAAAYGLNIAVYPLEFTTACVLHQGFLITGIISWVIMMELIVIASRPSWLETVTGTSLDRLMAVHRILGWWLLTVLAVHFAWPLIADLIPAWPVPAMRQHLMRNIWEVIWIWLHPIGALSGILLSIWMLWIIAGDIGRHHARLPWSRWERRHKCWAWLFLGLSLHSVRLLHEEELFMPLGVLVVLVTLLGCVASLRILIARPGEARRSDAVVESVSCLDGMVRLEIRTPASRSYRAGHFAYLQLLEDREDPHPFSVSGIDSDKGTVVFWIKQVGTWTESLSSLRKGDAVLIEGPWGRFFPDHTAPKQSWIAGGIGIAPFIAWLQDRARSDWDNDATVNVTLHWCVHQDPSEAILGEVRELCERASVTLVMHVSTRLQRHARIDELIGQDADVVAVCAGRSLVAGVRRECRRIAASARLMSECF